MNRAYLGLVVMSVVAALGVGCIAGREALRRQPNGPRQTTAINKSEAHARADPKASEYVKGARKALESLQDVQSLVRHGITLIEYQRRIGDAGISVDRFLRAHPVDLAPPSRENIESTLRLYETVARGWEGEIRAEAYGQNRLASQLKGAMQDCWKVADRGIAEADRVLFKASEGRKTHLEIASHLSVLPQGQVSQVLELAATGELHRLRDMERWDIETLFALHDLARSGKADRAYGAASIILSKLYLPDLAAIEGEDPKGLALVAKQAKAGGWSFRRRAGAGQALWRVERHFASLDEFCKEDVSRLSRFVGRDPKADGKGARSFWDGAGPLYGDARLRARNFLFMVYYAWDETLPPAQTQGWAKGNRFERTVAGELFPTRYRVTLPGTVTSTNGRLGEGGSAEWYYPSLFEFERGQTFRVCSRYVHWYALGGALAGIAGASTAWLCCRRKRGLKPSAPAA